jgi:hypothetical protein
VAPRVRLEKNDFLDGADQPMVDRFLRDDDAYRRRPRQPGPNQGPTTPDFPGLSQTSPDIRATLNCGNRTQHDIVRRNPAAWHAEGQGFESP